ncbi:hypothetical protein GCM10023093_06790 [Nemorincola caseinilytica]|uniref:Glycosyltransferase RgtA/B/C/D-like domain-containing protein n=1 Tax=Nemorincola caseinilytica TaxID=2054315 RepID=A0ABP8N8A8_9BACT
MPAKTSYISHRILFYIALLVFIIFKIPYLSDAFYWDESWVYAPAIKSMYQAGPSLMPDVIPVEYSRGHPLLHQFACAVWMYVFGSSNLSMHSFALFLSAMLAISLFEVMRRLFDENIALISALLLLVNVTFFAQSSFVMTDIPLALFALLGIYYYAGERYIRAILALTVLYYIKESAWMMAFVLAADVAVSVWKKAPRKVIISRVLATVLPVLFIFVYFLLQKIRLGWFLYPAHTDIIDASLFHTLDHFQRILTLLFWTDQIFLYHFALVLACVILYIRTRRRVFLYITAAYLVIYLHTVVLGYKDLLYYVFIIAMLVAFIAFLRSPLSMLTRPQARFLKLSTAFSVAFSYFSSINFYEERYAFVVLLLMFFIPMGIAYGRIVASLGRGKWVIAWVLVLQLGCPVYITGNNQMIAYERIRAQQQLVDYMESQGYYDKIICAPSYLERVHLNDAATGFLNSPKIFPHVYEHMSASTELLIFDNIEPDVLFHRQVMADTNFHLVHKITYKRAWIEVYERRK